MALENELLKLCHPSTDDDRMLEVDDAGWSPMPFGRPSPLLIELLEESELERSLRSVPVPTVLPPRAAVNDDGLPDEPLEFLWHAA